MFNWQFILYAVDNISDPLDKAKRLKNMIAINDEFIAKYSKDEDALRMRQELVKRQQELSKII